MSIEEIRHLARELAYWVNMSTDIKNTITQCVKCLEYQQIQQHEKTVLYKVPCMPLEVVGADIFSLKIKHFCAM